MLRKMRKTMGDRDRPYRLEGLVEMDDAFIGGRRHGGKCGRGAEGKTPLLAWGEGKKAGFIAIGAIPSVCSALVQPFATR